MNLRCIHSCKQFSMLFSLVNISRWSWWHFWAKCALFSAKGRAQAELLDCHHRPAEWKHVKTTTATAAAKSLPQSLINTLQSATMLQIAVCFGNTQSITIIWIIWGWLFWNGAWWGQLLGKSALHWFRLCLVQEEQQLECTGCPFKCSTESLNAFVTCSAQTSSAHLPIYHCIMNWLDQVCQTCQGHTAQRGSSLAAQSEFSGSNWSNKESSDPKTASEQPALDLEDRSLASPKPSTTSSNGVSLGQKQDWYIFAEFSHVSWHNTTHNTSTTLGLRASYHPRLRKTHHVGPLPHHYLRAK